MMPQAHLDAVQALLPEDLRAQFDTLPPSASTFLDALIRFVSGSPCPPHASTLTHTQWSANQPNTLQSLAALASTPTLSKRARSRSSSPSAPSTKRPKPDADPPLFTIHALSVSAPLRKKLDVSVHAHTLRFAPPDAPTSASISLPTLTRAFLLPTRGRPRPHWTVLLLSSDAPPARDSKSPSPEVIFGVDAIPTVLATTAYPQGDQNASATKIIHPKGTSALSSVHTFLSHLPVPFISPSPAAFTSAADSACAGVAAHRGARPGTLWFLDSGLLWDARPCEFWALSDIASARDGEDGDGLEGVRTVSATGRTCSVVIRRRVRLGDSQSDDGEDEWEEIETDIGMVEGREQAGIARWVKTHRARFGQRVQDAANGNGANKGANGADSSIENANGTKDGAAQPDADEDESDAEDEDFVVDSGSDDGSVSDSSSSSGAGSAVHSANGEADDGDDDDSEDDDETGGAEETEIPLDPTHHPLMRPGAMPRMSRAAIDAVVGIVRTDMGLDPGGGGLQEEDEEDELEE